jgi:flagellar basal-body rod protein FlgF
MDALIFAVMSGAERVLHAQQVRANNLANADTTGFRADYEVATSQAVAGQGFDARHMSRVEMDRVGAREGPTRETGRDLDVAVTGNGLLAVAHGQTEAYTRAGALAVDADGRLLLMGREVLGDGGPIVLPAFSRLSISEDGTISVQTEGNPEMQPVDRMKLVRPDPQQRLVKNEAGLLVTPDRVALDADDTVRVRGGALEGSNVRAVEEMVAVIDLARQFEIQMKLYKAADSMAEHGNRLVRD